MKKIQEFSDYNDLYNKVERYINEHRSDISSELTKFSMILQLIRNQVVTTDDIVQQLIQSNSYYEVANEAERLGLIFGEEINGPNGEIKIEKGVVVRDTDTNELYVLVDSITSSTASWINISETSLDAFVELLIEQPTPVINVRNIELPEDNVWIGDELNRPVPNPVGITIIGTATLVAGTIIIEDDLITPESIVTLSATTTGTLTGNLRFEVSEGQVIVQSRNSSNTIINTDTVTFHFNIETGVNDTLRKSKYIIVNSPIPDYALDFGPGYLINDVSTPFIHWERTQPFTMFIKGAFPGNTLGQLFDTRTALWGGIYAFFANSSGLMEFRMERFNTAVGSTIFRVTIPASTEIIQIVYNGSSLVSGYTVYADGVELPKTTLSDTLTSSILGGTHRFRIGANVLNSGLLNTYISELSILDAAQNAAAIAADVLAGTQQAGSDEFLFRALLTYPTYIQSLNTLDVNTTLPLLTQDTNAYKLNLQNYPSLLVLGTNFIEI
ncbi:MAG: hypothetical protein HC917_05530 [Richelia sp. SM2_1_7]|nr:hypothetical protein [Richelia sp. SM2_1_7]